MMSPKAYPSNVTQRYSRPQAVGPGPIGKGYEGEHLGDQDFPFAIGRKRAKGRQRNCG